jgi:hypothetical protein
MKSDLQLAALQRLARLTQSEQLSPERRATLTNRVLKKCRDRRGSGINGIKGVNGFNGGHQSMV